MNEQPDHGNWVSRRLIFVFAIPAFILFALAMLSLIAVIPAALCTMLAIYFAYARHEFAPQGGNLQERVWGLVVEHLDWDGEGRALDIGCGNGALTIKLGRKFENARMVGIDHWGKNWEYSQKTCERNAAIAGVEERLSFQKASASELPFDDGYSMPWSAILCSTR